MPNSLVNVPLTDGVNLLKDPRRIGDNQAVKTTNMVPVIPGVLRSRPGASIECLTEQTASLAVPIVAKATPFGLDWPDHIRITRRVAATEATTQVAAGWFNTVGLGTYGADLGIVTQYNPQILFTGEKAYIFGGYGCASPGKVFYASSPGAYAFSDFAFAGSGNTNIWPQVASVYRERVLYGNLGPGLESTMILSDTGAPTVIGDNAIGSRDFTVGDGDGDRIVAQQEIMQDAVGTYANVVTLVLKEYSAYILTGLPSESDDTFSLSDFTINKVSTPCGCASRETLVQTPYGLIWAGPDDIWLFTQGQLPIRIGTNIRPALQQTPANLRYRWHAAYFNGFYRLAIFGEGQGPNDDSPCQDQYWLDLRDGAPTSVDNAKWWGPQQYKFVAPHTSGSVLQEGTYNFVPRVVVGQENQLYSIITGYQSGSAYDLLTASMDSGGPYESNSLYPANLLSWVTLTPYVLNDLVTLNGNTYKCITLGTSGATGPTGYYESTDGTAKWRYVGPSWFPAHNDTSSNTNINAEIVSKVYDFGDPIVRKVYKGAELDLYTSQDCQAAWDVVLDDGRESSLDNRETILGTGFQAGYSVLDTDVTSREFQSVFCAPDSGSRFLGKLVQFKLRNKPGYIIVEDYNDQMIIGSYGGLSTPIDDRPRAVVIPAGFYASYATLFSAIQTAINAALLNDSVAVTVSRGSYGVIEILSNGTQIGINTDGFVASAVGLDSDVVRRTAAMLGFQSGQYEVDSGTVSKVLNGLDPLRYGRTPTWELGNILLKIRAVPRRPS